MYATKRLRDIANAKFNLNLFKILIAPSYALMKGVCFWMSDKDKQLGCTHYRQMFKLFMGLPRSTPNEVIKLIAGDLEKYLRTGSINCDIKNDNRFGSEGRKKGIWPNLSLS
jgi:hypothetical protein